MANISSNFLGIKSPNPFWLASAPPRGFYPILLLPLKIGEGIAQAIHRFNFQINH
jgi:hypothetical protein